MQGCESCCYFSDEGKCLVHKRVSSKQREQGCASFIDKDFRPQEGGCCGIYNMPHSTPVKDTDE